MQSIVLRHLNVLLGYSATEKSFTVPPEKLRYCLRKQNNEIINNFPSVIHECVNWVLRLRSRSSSICSAFLSGLPDVLDQNLLLGNQILPIATKLLLYLPSTQRFASDSQPADYSLWFLEMQTRHSWLWALLLILYKAPSSALLRRPELILKNCFCFLVSL